MGCRCDHLFQSWERRGAELRWTGARPHCAATLVWRLPWGGPQVGWGLRAAAHALPLPPQTVEHGFPNQPSALAFDPELRIMAIGTRSGAVKMYPLRTEAFKASRDLLLAAPCVLIPGAWPTLGGHSRCLGPGGGLCSLCP